MVTRKANSRVYWADRETQDRNVFGEIEGVIAREQNVIAKEKKIYAAARADLDREMKTLLDDVGEEAVTQAILQKPLTAKELEDWSHRQQNRLDELIAQFGEKEGRKKYGLEIAATGKQSRANRVVRRVTALKNSIDLIADASAEKVESVTSEALHKEVKKGAESFSNQISTGLDVDFNANSEKATTRVAQTVFKAEDFSDRIWANRDVLVEDLNRSVGLAVTNGWSIDRLSKEFEHNVAVNERSSERISRTEINRISNQTELVYYKENKIKYYRFVATEDARTCDICGKLHDQIFAVDSAETGANFPPVHPNCRCRTVISTVDENGNEDDSWLDDMQKEIDEAIAEVDSEENKIEEVNAELHRINTNKDLINKKISEFKSWKLSLLAKKVDKDEAIQSIKGEENWKSGDDAIVKTAHVWSEDGKHYVMDNNSHEFPDFKIVAIVNQTPGSQFYWKSENLPKDIDAAVGAIISNNLDLNSSKLLMDKRNAVRTHVKSVIDDQLVIEEKRKAFMNWKMRTLNTIGE